MYSKFGKGANAAAIYARFSNDLTLLNKLNAKNITMKRTIAGNCIFFVIKEIRII